MLLMTGRARRTNILTFRVHRAT